jgi:hypothetical protein
MGQAGVCDLLWPFKMFLNDALIFGDCLAFVVRKIFGP